MERLLRSAHGGRIFAAVAVVGQGIFILATGVLMAPFAPALGDRMAEMSCLQVAFSAERAQQILLSFDTEAQAAIASLLIPGDVTFAWGYGLLFAGLIGLLTRRLEGAWFRAGTIIVWMPLAAALFDCIEDIFLYNIVNQVIAAPDAGITPLLPVLAGIAAVFKYLALSVISPAFAIAGSVKGITIDRSIGAWITYVLIVLLALSMVVQPLQRIPACF